MRRRVTPRGGGGPTRLGRNVTPEHCFSGLRNPVFGANGLRRTSHVHELSGFSPARKWGGTMTVSNRRIFVFGACVCLLMAATPHAQRAASGRALTIEDYYEIQTVGSP